MNHLIIDVAIVITLFVIGTSWTVVRYARHDRLAFTVVAILSPLLISFSVGHTLYLAIRGRLALEPCPPGLEAAELIVEQERQKLFGGTVRPPMISANWKRAYNEDLQRKAVQVQRLAERYLQHA